MKLKDLFKPSIGEEKANRIVDLMELKGVRFNRILSSRYNMQVIDNTDAIEQILKDVNIVHSLGSAILIKRIAIVLDMKGRKHVINHFSKELNKIWN